MIFLRAAVCILSVALCSFAKAESSSLAEVFSQGLIHDGGLLSPSATLQTAETVESVGDFELVSVTLSHSTSGKIRLLLKGVQGFRQRSPGHLKTLFLVSGFDTGAESVRLLGDIKNTVLVGFQYPFGLQDFERNPQLILEFFRRTPAQIALALEWLSEQPWIDRQALITLGVSLGGLFLPSSLYLAQKLAAAPSHTIFVCTGADLRPIVEKHLGPILNSDRAQSVGQALTVATLPLNPQIYLPFLTGSFLSLRTDHDQTIPLSSSLRLESLLKGPLTVRVLQGPHIDVDQDQVISQVKLAIRQWLAL